MKSLLAIAILLTSLSFAADTGEVNEEIRQRNREKRRETIREVGYFFDDALGNPSYLKFKPFKKRKLTRIEKNYRPLFKCLVKVGRKKFGGDYGLDIVGEILDSITTSEGELVQDGVFLSQMMNECRNLRKNFEADRADRWMYARLIKNSSFKLSTKRFLLAIYHNFTLSCSVTSLKAQAAFIMGGSVGGTVGKCLFSNGKIRRYLGPSGGMEALSISLRVLFDRYIFGDTDIKKLLDEALENNESNMRKGNDFVLDGLALTEGIAGLSSIGPLGFLSASWVDDPGGKEAELIDRHNVYSDPNRATNLTLGAGMAMMAAYGSVLVEAAPRGMNWGHLYDLLKTNDQNEEL